MVTGDSSVNPDAPIICCTAEILANLALRHGDATPVDQVVMDEFHFYGDPERGWAWQVPLLLLPRAQFVLMSATLGDVTELAADLSRRTGRQTAEVTGVDRPVPLHFYYATTPVHETIEELLDTGQAPVYVVHFSQAAALERAQALTSVKVLSREQRDEIAEAIGDFRFTTAFGKTPVAGWCAAASACTTRACCRATGGWSNSSRSAACCASSAAPTRSASASTCRSAPCCSRRSPSSTARGCGS